MNKKTSEVINSNIPAFRRPIVFFECSPSKEDSAKTSDHQLNIRRIIISPAKSGPTENPCIRSRVAPTKYRAEKEPTIGQGLGVTRWSI